MKDDCPPKLALRERPEFELVLRDGPFKFALKDGAFMFALRESPELAE